MNTNSLRRGYWLMLGFLLLATLPPSPSQPSSTSDAPRNVILMIGDGMGLSQLTAALIANGNKLEMERCKHIGMIKTFSADNLITDSAAGATAFSTGEKTYNGAIGVDTEKRPQPTILEQAAAKGYQTGLIATSAITHATPACFYAHQPLRTMYDDIALDLISAPVDVFMGGGREYFQHRRDEKNLIDSLKNRGFQLTYKWKDAKKVESGKLAHFGAEKHLKPRSAGRGNFLPKATELAIDLLNQHEKGFFLLVEASQIDWGGHAGDSQYIITETQDFDKTVGKVLDFAEQDGNTLVIITADHETGGYSVNGGSLETQYVDGQFTTDKHTASLIPVYAFGPGAENFMGIYDNTQIYHKMTQTWWK